MIAASEPQEFIPFGRQQVSVHPGEVQIGVQEYQQQHHLENALSSKFSEVIITEDEKGKESWVLRQVKHEATECEEELYWKGKTVVWSMGASSIETQPNRILKCCYTSQLDVIQALWCNLHLSPSDITASFVSCDQLKRKLSSAAKKTYSKVNESLELKNCICILDSTQFRFYTKSGNEYLTALQFPVEKMWPHKYGLLLERKVSQLEYAPEFKSKPPAKTSNVFSLHRQSMENSFLQKSQTMETLPMEGSTFGGNSTQYFNIPSILRPPEDITSSASASKMSEDSGSDLPIVFSLTHPLDEICPVVIKNENTLSYFSNRDVRIVMTSESPSLCITQDMKTGLFSAYFIRNASPIESEVCLHRESMMSRLNQINSFGNLSQTSFSGGHLAANVSLPAFLNTKTRKSLGLSMTKFPNHSFNNSPLNFEGARYSSPLPSRGLGSVSPLFTHNHYTPSPRRVDSPLGSAPTPSRMMTEDVDHAEAKPLFPQICLQLIWSQPVADTQVGGIQKLSKAFITTDLTQQMYLCYFPHNKFSICMLKMKRNTDESCVVFGDPIAVPAKYAVPLDSLNMLAIISLDGGVELYTGPILVGKLLISGVPSSVATSSYLANSHAGPTFFTKCSNFPKRSSLLPQSVAHLSPVFSDSLGQFSPVSSLMDSSCGEKVSPSLTAQTPIGPREGALLALRDPVGNRLTLEYSSGALFRVEMPCFHQSPLVKDSLSSLCKVLPSSHAIQLSTKWYTTRNMPGTKDMSLLEEFNLFTDVLLSLIGYDLGLLKGNKYSIDSSPVTRPKKQRTSNQESDEDWQYLLNSAHHAMFRKNCFLESLQRGTQPSSGVNIQPDIQGTPVVSNTRNFSEETPDVSTPLESSTHSSGKLKSSFSRFHGRSGLDLIEETPIPKSTVPKSRLQSNRFQMRLDEGDSSPQLFTISEPQTSLVSSAGPLYQHTPLIVLTLHLLYEDMKLNVLKQSQLPALAKLLHRLVVDLGLSTYVRHYWLDFPHLCQLHCDLAPEGLAQNSVLPPRPPHVFQQLYDMLLKKKVQTYPHQVDVNNRSRNIIQLVGLLSYGYDDPSINLNLLVACKNSVSVKTTRVRSHRPIPHRAILLMNQMGMTQDMLPTLPSGVCFILFEALYSCRDKPGLGWSKETYNLAMRHDLASLRRQDARKEVGPTNELILPSLNNSKNFTLRSGTELEEDGMEDLPNLDVLKLRYSSDQRVLEARRMLQSGSPVRIAITQRPDVSDHEFIQEQEKHLYAICTRTMALAVGRGMVTLRTATPVLTEKLPIPQLCLTGRVPATDKTVDMSHIELVANMNVWPLFHNGVAAGLRLSNMAADIDSQWIIYNKPKTVQTNSEDQIEHAGFLMALGLNGHLGDLLDHSIYAYLIKFHEMTSVGLLLGVAASKRGTMDVSTVKVVSIHVEAMLPPTGIELDVEVVVEPAALMALGLLYQGTTHRHVAQVLLQEIGRPPGPEMENSVDRESYSLAAGLALGMVIFGKGDSLSELRDMAIPDTLRHFMVGGPKRPYLGSQHEKYKTPSFLIWEGDLVNTHVTGPGATLALGMFYFNTGNRAVSEWLKVPETQHLLEMVLPDALLLRTLARGLVLWADIQADEDWVIHQVPEFVRPYCLVKPLHVPGDEDVDYETMNQAYCNIVAGACMAIGLRYAGSAHHGAFVTLLSFARKFTSLLGKSIAELCGKSTIETCLNVITVSLAMVMCGTGDLEVLRLCRYLRSRVGPTNAVVTYGSHLATHMALGLLFLGGGAYSLSTSPEAIAVLLCAFYPKWPIHSNDNRYHLQALRHLYVLAVEPRLLLTRDIDTRTACYIHVTCLYLDTSDYPARSLTIRAPCILSELSQLKEVRIEDSRYWSIVFKRDTNWSELETILAECSFVDVKQRAGCLSYLEDPQGFRTLLAQTLTSDDVIPWSVPVESIFAFSSDPILVNLTQYFLEGHSPPEEYKLDDNPLCRVEDKILTWLTYVTYFCLTKDKLCLLPVWVSLLQHGQATILNPTSSAVWNLKLMWTQSLRSSGCNVSTTLVPPDMALSVRQFIHAVIEKYWDPVCASAVRAWLSGSNLTDVDLETQGKLTALLTMYDLHELVEDGAVKDFITGWTGDDASLMMTALSKDWSPAAAVKLRRLLNLS